MMQGWKEPCYHTQPQRRSGGRRTCISVWWVTTRKADMQGFFLTPTGNNHHPLTQESWWCSLCCRQTRKRGWCWLLYEQPSAWQSRVLWYRRNSQSHHGSFQNWNTQNKDFNGGKTLCLLSEAFKFTSVQLALLPRNLCMKCVWMN